MNSSEVNDVSQTTDVNSSEVNDFTQTTNVNSSDVNDVSQTTNINSSEVNDFTQRTNVNASEVNDLSQRTNVNSSEFNDLSQRSITEPSNTQMKKKSRKSVPRRDVKLKCTPYLLHNNVQVSSKYKIYNRRVASIFLHCYRNLYECSNCD